MDTETLAKAPKTPEAMAYLAAVQTTQLILQDAATLARNNHMVFTSATALALKNLEQGKPEGETLLREIEKAMASSQEYLAKTGSICAQILAEFKALT
ncbi:hypothetical protein [Gilvimarinus algae]|uniref:Phasin domain-containing protein n=1 Tax=Gilvimarinus algae TaxID=3058037 RepID=A0ABT8T9F0_9GAMM|nr:hypothetical protein [Gilvimarinus sp. SDUM040014]MDO3380761.1 hypothetical protein [Gilvimarinus sp. SDUM040014]